MSIWQHLNIILVFSLILSARINKPLSMPKAWYKWKRPERLYQGFHETEIGSIAYIETLASVKS
jgi:hypothetical protein